MNLLRSSFHVALRVMRLEPTFRLARGYHRRIGWLRSCRERASVDAEGRPVPWITYPAYHLLASRVAPAWHVWEFGAGNSTSWWAARVERVVAVEHDEAWVAEVRKRIASNAEVVHAALGPAYPATIERERPSSFHVIVVDGRMRVACIGKALPHLRPDGILILDNSDRAEYGEGIESLRLAGFKELPLIGLAPGLWDETRTSIFYRPDNVLGL